MDIKQFRSLIDEALLGAGYSPHKLAPDTLVSWQKSKGEVVPLFLPHAMRRPWGFKLSGEVGIEVPQLRSWLNQHKGKEGFGAFRRAFVCYNILNDPHLSAFGAGHGRPLPVDDWVETIDRHLMSVPSTLDELIDTYQAEPSRFGWWAKPESSWDFLIRWRSNPDPELEVPQRWY